MLFVKDLLPGVGNITQKEFQIRQQYKLEYNMKERPLSSSS